MLTVIFALTCTLIVSISYRVSKNIINVVSVFTVPYMLFIPINNLIMVKRGFFRISDQVIYMIGGCLICITIGYILANYLSKPLIKYSYSSSYHAKKLFSNYRISSMLKYVFFVETIVLVRLLFIILTHNISYIVSADFEGHMLRGPLGHLLLTIYPIVPILFLYWLYNKQKLSYLFATIICVTLLFSTFVKYHVIGMIVLIFLFVVLEDKRYLYKGLIFVTTFAIFAFILNYLISFLLRGTISNVAQNYYFDHLWDYMAGSLIYDNQIFTTGVRTDINIFYKICTVIFAVPNVILNSFFGVRIFPHIALPHIPVGTNGQPGNVVDAFGYFFPSKRSLMEIIFYFIFLIFIGFSFTLMYISAMSRTNNFRITVCVFMTFFIFFSFFGTFYILLPPWEILIYSILMLKIFDKRKLKTNSV